ncbi:MAG: SDR family NAD(P)-dependent oxidoreductase [Alcanivorax sp.]|nr:SDR family NAD(P)-dependent oxidoreductase [Alcanivorax sp.]
MDISNTVALVTGGASGLGRATVEALVAKGAKAVVLDLPGTGDDVAAALGDSVKVVGADVRDADQVQAAVDAAAELGELRIVVNCAGTGDAIKTVGRENAPYPLEKFQRIIEINLIGTFNVTRLAAAHIAGLDPVGEERGVIVNTASVAAFDGQIGQAAYSASKGGIVGMTLPIAREYARIGVRVNAVAPGIFLTPMAAGMPEHVQEALGAAVPFPSRLGKPEEFADLVAHIMENGYINGETIRLDGAARLAPK